jgi:hypothetical protein
MPSTIKTTITILIAVAVTVLGSGSTLLAQDKNTADVITAADRAFIQAAPTGTVTHVAATEDNARVSLLTPADHTFTARPFVAPVGNQQAAAALPSAGIITAADYQFLTTGQGADVFTASGDFADSLAGRKVR